MLNLHTILSRGLREPLKTSKKDIILWRQRIKAKNVAAIQKTDEQGDSEDRKAEWGLYITITEAQSGRNGNEGMNIFKEFSKSTWSFCD